MNKLSVPYYSQHRDVEDPDWQIKSCAIACIKMVMEFLNNDNQNLPSIDELIKEGIIIGAHSTSSGWIHAGLVRLAHNHGYSAYNEEFRSIRVDIAEATFNQSEHEEILLNKAISKIKRKIENNFPVIISCSAGWQDIQRYHQVVIIGIEEEGKEVKGFYYHEPEAKSELEGANRFVDIETFKTHWRKFAIFLGK